MEASRALEQAARPLPRPRRSADRTFEQLYERHARDVYQYALALLTNPADAEDVTQTTFMNAYRALQRGDRPQRPHNWLIAIAHNVCRMRWRQAGHRPKETPLEDAPEPVAALRDDQPNLDDVLHALSRLSFNQRSALVMRELEGRSCNEIGETLGLSVSAVEALLFRARRRLQIERKALGVLGAAPLPGSLASALGIGGGGGGASAGGLIALGGDAVLKAATGLVIAGAIASGAVAIAKPAPKYRLVAPPKTQVKQTHKAAATPHAKRATTHRRARPTLRAKPRPTANPPVHAATTQEAGSTSTQSGQAPAPPAVRVPKLPKLPLPPPPVQLPPIQLPGLPIGLPPLPPAPPVPPLPPLPPL